MRIAALTNNLLLGGANTFLLNFLREITGSPDSLRVISFTELNEHAADFAALHADVHCCPADSLIYEDRLAWAYSRLAEYRPHAILACLGAESFELTRVVPAGVARVGLVQSDDPMVYRMAGWYPATLDAMVGVSERIAEKLRIQPEFREVNVRAIPYGIAFAPADNRMPPPPESPVRVLYLGRLIEGQKRISRIESLIQQLEQRAAPVRFTLAGNGPDEASVRAALASSRITSFAGVVPNHQVPHLLREHDVFILLSDFEGLPLSLLEAMGAGVVPVVSDLPSGVREAVAPGTGIRLPIGDVAAAVEAIEALAAERPRLAQLSAAASTHARQHFSATRMVQQYRELIAELAPAPETAWPAQVPVPTPFGVPAWRFSGWRRSARRFLKARFAQLS